MNPNPEKEQTGDEKQSPAALVQELVDIAYDAEYYYKSDRRSLRVSKLLKQGADLRAKGKIVVGQPPNTTTLEVTPLEAAAVGNNFLGFVHLLKEYHEKAPDLLVQKCIVRENAYVANLIIQ